MYHVIARADRAGSHFFDAATMRFFNSRVLNATLTQMDATGDVFRFVTSELMPGDPRREYTVRQVTFRKVPNTPSGAPQAERVLFDTIGEFQAYNSAAQARRHIRDDA